MRRLATLIVIAAAARCTYDPECKDRPGHPFRGPADLAVSDDELAVTNANNRNKGCYNFLTLFDRRAVLESSPGSQPPYRFIETDAFNGPMAVDASGRWIYTASRQTDRLQVIDLRTGGVDSLLETGPDPYAVARIADWNGQGDDALLAGSLGESELRLYDLSNPDFPVEVDTDGEASNGLTRLDIGADDGLIPERILADPAGGRAWVGYQVSFTSQVGAELTWQEGVFSVRRFSVPDTGIEVGRSGAIAYDPDTRSLWMSVQLINTANVLLNQGLARFDGDTLELTQWRLYTPDTGVRALEASEGRLYAAVYSLDQVWVLDAAGGTVLAKLRVGDGPASLRAEGDRLLVLNYLSDSLMTVDLDPVSPTHLQVLGVIE